MKILSLLNNKGGVGKTTISTNLAAQRARKGSTTLLIDMDPQQNASEALGVSRNVAGFDSYLNGSLHLGQVALEQPGDPDNPRTKVPGLYVIPAGPGLQKAADLLSDASLTAHLERFRASLAEFDAEATTQGARLDLIVLDLRPALDRITTLGLAVSDFVAVPLECAESSLSGLLSLDAFVTEVRDRLNPGLKWGGAFVNKYRENGSQRQFVAEVRAVLRRRLLSTIVPLNQSLADGYTARCPAVSHFPASDGAKAIRALSKDLFLTMGL
ncbi:MAG TPA: ParA family protein [bacterium]|jgi:chromosome partitioning protein|nr:ParA family protein [bacterium]